MASQERRAEKGEEMLIRQLQRDIAFLETDLERASEENKQEVRDAMAKKRIELEKLQAPMQ